jgi:hypothetical protein
VPSVHADTRCCGENFEKSIEVTPLVVGAASFNFIAPLSTSCTSTCPVPPPLPTTRPNIPYFTVVTLLSCPAKTLCLRLRFRSHTDTSSPALVPPTAKYLDPALKSIARTSPISFASSGTYPSGFRSGFISADPLPFVPTHNAPFVGDQRAQSGSPESSFDVLDDARLARALSGTYTRTEEDASEVLASLPTEARSMTEDDIARDGRWGGRTTHRAQQSTAFNRRLRTEAN